MAFNPTPQPHPPSWVHHQRPPHYPPNYPWPPPPSWGPFPPTFPAPPLSNPNQFPPGNWMYNRSGAPPSTWSSASGTAPGSGSSGTSSAAGWAGPGFGQPPGGNFNPYKRTPNPGDADYWATKLTDNPLGLENMHIRDPSPHPELRAAPTGAVPVPDTSWMWVPETNGNSASRPSRDHEGHRDEAQPERHRSPSHRNQMQNHARVPSQSRPAATSHRRSTPSPSPRRSSSDSSSSSSSGGSSVSTEPEHNHAQTHAYMREPETFTAKKALQPTFSPNIVRTPNHYKHGSGTPSRQSSHDSASHDGSPIAQLNRSTSLRTPARHSSAPASTSPHIYAPASSRSQQQQQNHISEEPLELLSPLMSSATPKPTQGDTSLSRALGRAATYPLLSASSSGSSTNVSSPLAASPDAASSSRGNNSIYAMFDASPDGSGSGLGGGGGSGSTRQSPARRLDPSPRQLVIPDPPSSYSHSRSPSRTPSHTPRPSPSSSYPSSSYPRTRTHSLVSNPLPPAPVPHSTLSPPPRSPSPPPAHYTQRIRRGLWNSRGDHLTLDFNVVYAPPERANPPELRHYPHPTEGFMDHVGTFVKYDPKRPELPQSLPRHGMSPEQPYDIFVQYIYR